MADSIPEKSYFRIGEVSKILGVAPYVIRYWESEFKSVRPMRARSDQRLYRRTDVEELILIKELLYNEKFTINGANKRLREMKKQGAVDGNQGTAAENEQKLLAQIKRGLQEIRDIIR
ncbi:MAG: MerR family transcriptional regulator [Syntrophales bacterium LBB04]|nr:MerR family transcriptional regulator [Syntrophales bacterium LBB04]